MLAYGLESRVLLCNNDSVSVLWIDVEPSSGKVFSDFVDVNL